MNFAFLLPVWNDGVGFVEGPPLGHSDVERDIEILDVDGDGDQDVLAGVDVGPPTILGWLGNGKGGLGPTQELGQLSGAPVVLELADLDGDGDLDLLSCPDGHVAWSEQLGSAQFGAPRTVTDAVAGANQVVAMDVDEDGMLDAVAVTDGELVWMRNGLCSATPTTGDTGTPASSTGGDETATDTGTAGPDDTQAPQTPGAAEGAGCGCDGTGRGVPLAIVLTVLAVISRTSSLQSRFEGPTR